MSNPFDDFDDEITVDADVDFLEEIRRLSQKSTAPQQRVDDFDDVTEAADWREFENLSATPAPSAQPAPAQHWPPPGRSTVPDTDYPETHHPDTRYEVDPSDNSQIGWADSQPTPRVERSPVSGVHGRLAPRADGPPMPGAEDLLRSEATVARVPSGPPSEHPNWSEDPRSESQIPAATPFGLLDSSVDPGLVPSPSSPPPAAVSSRPGGWQPTRRDVSSAAAQVVPVRAERRLPVWVVPAVTAVLLFAGAAGFLLIRGGNTTAADDTPAADAEADAGGGRTNDAETEGGRGGGDDGIGGGGGDG